MGLEIPVIAMSMDSLTGEVSHFVTGEVMEVGSTDDNGRRSLILRVAGLYEQTVTYNASAGTFVAGAKRPVVVTPISRDGKPFLQVVKIELYGQAPCVVLPVEPI